MIGNPKYNCGDEVMFVLTEDGGRVHFVKGIVAIVDKYGTFEQNEEVSYDILVEDWLGGGETILAKHIQENVLISLEEE